MAGEYRTRPTLSAAWAKKVDTREGLRNAACLVRSQRFYGVDRGGATGRQIACGNCHQAQECGARDYAVADDGAGYGASGARLVMRHAAAI